MKPILIKVMICFSFLLFFSNALSATAVEWTGDGDGIFWSDPNNWDTGAVPDFGSEVVLPENSGQIYFDVEFASLSTLIIHSGVKLRILESNSLYLSIDDYLLFPYDTITLVNRGHLQNDGQLFIFNGIGGGIWNYGTIINTGHLHVRNFLTASLYNSGTVENINNGVMELFSFENEAIIARGTFYNNAIINTIGEQSGSNSGIAVYGNFMNDLNGEINIRYSIRGLYVAFNGSMVNLGHIEIEGDNYYNSFINVQSEGSFLNGNTGQLSLNNGQAMHGISIGENCSFTNEGNLEIRSVDSEYGIYVSESGTFTNLENGASPTIGVFNDGEVENSGVINISDALVGIENNFTFNNLEGGSLQISAIEDHGIYNGYSAEFKNEAASIRCMWRYCL